MTDFGMMSVQARQLTTPTSAPALEPTPLLLQEFTTVVPLFVVNRVGSVISQSSEMETTLVHLAQGLPGTTNGQATVSV